MSSAYPPPPQPAAAGGATATSQALQQPASPHQQAAAHQYENGLASPGAQSTATALHHGLQALQAATGVPVPVPGPSPVTSQYAPLPSPHGSDAQYIPPPGSGAPTAAPGGAQPPSAKVTRLRRACDMCSQRKVKCDESGPPCRPCRDLNVDCTFEREMKRRGPPNKHAEAAKAAKRPRLEPNMTPSPHNAAETLVSIATHDGSPILDAEAIAPWQVLVLLVDDFFTYIHPLTPFPHEPTFRQSLANREDRTSREFLALLASMIGALVASFPRTARLHLKSQHSTNLFPRATIMIERCRAVALEARGVHFNTKDEMTVHDAATSYFLGLSAGYTMQWSLCRRFLTESMFFIRELGYNRPRGSGTPAMGSVPYSARPVDHIHEQIGKRIFWVLLLGIRSMAQIGASHSEIVLPPPTPGEPYPELPVEVDDQYIESHQILQQPEGIVPLIAGFNQAIRIYMTMNPLVSIELSYGINTLPFHDQKDMLKDCLDAVKHVTDDIPRELALSLTPAPNSDPPAPGAELSAPVAPLDDFYDDAPGFQYYPPAYPDHRPPDDLRRIFETHPQRRRLLQFQIQKANIYVSQLATRSYYVERYLNLRDAHREHARAQAAQASYAAENAPADAVATSNGSGADSKAVAAAAMQAAAEQSDPIDAAMTAERELIVRNLLTVLASIPQRNMEPNGASLINKIRQVASTLLNDSPERKGPVATEAEQHLARFVDILMRLDRTGPSAAGGEGGPSLGTMTPLDEEEELRSWADWREYQARFASRGGFMGS